MKHHIILRIVTKLLIPPIILFAFYVQFHGDFGPGGGFQAGVIFAAAFILHGLVFGLEQTRRILPNWLLRTLASAGVILFAGVGFASLLTGGNFLEYNTLAATATGGQHLGILLVELGVGLTVSAVMMIIFYTFAGLKADD